MESESFKRKLSFIGYIGLALMITSAGPYGFEYTVNAVGIEYTLIGTCIFCIFYALPVSLITSELSSMMPTNHGQILWVFRGYSIKYKKFGDFCGFINSLNYLIFFLCEIATAPIVFVAYFELLVGKYTYLIEYSIMLGVVVISVIINIFNIDIMGYIASILAVFMIAPFLIGFFIVLPDINVSNQWNLIGSNNECSSYNWSLFIGTIIWELSGFEGMASLTNEVNFKLKYIIYALIITIIIDIGLLIIPIITVATTIDTDNYDCSSIWYDGFFSEGYGNILVPLKYCILIGSLLTNWCLFSSGLAVVSRTIWALSQPNISIHNSGSISFNNENMFDEQINPNESMLLINNTDNDNISRTINIGVLPSWFGTVWKRTNSPIKSVLLVGVLTCILMLWLGFVGIVEFLVYFYVISSLFEIGAYLILKFQENKVHRSYVVPCGKCGGIIISLSLIIILIASLTILIMSNWFQFIIVIGINIGFILYYYFYRIIIYPMITNDDNEEYYTEMPQTNDDDNEIHPLI